MSIVTFYSYKGGVGRSMALANIAILLARRGLRVLVVDWDLEAPGIEKYFEDLRLTQSGMGLLPLLREVASGGSPNYTDFIWKASAIDAEFEFSLLQSGRESDPEYFHHMEQFNWTTFFEQGGGNYLEMLRECWLDHFDFVLVDSRTGLSDSGGICTIQLPDIVVALFTPSRQSLFGVRDVMRLARSARHRLAFDREALSIVPVPSRVALEELQSIDEWMDLFAKELKEFFSDWLPKGSDHRIALKRLTLNHASDLAHGERIAVLQPQCGWSLISTYEQLTTILESNLGDVSSLIATTTTASPTEKSAEVLRRSVHRERGGTRLEAEYEYDVFLSYPRSPLITQWVRNHLFPMVQGHLELRGFRVKVFFDQAELSVGIDWAAAQRRALLRSRLLLAIWSPQYFHSRWCLAEFNTFRERSKAADETLIVPIIIYGGESFPMEAKAIQAAPFHEFLIVSDSFKRHPKYIEFEAAVQKLCGQIAHRLERVPAFDPSWPIVEPSEVIIPDDTAKLRPRL